MKFAISVKLMTKMKLTKWWESHNIDEFTFVIENQHHPPWMMDDEWNSLTSNHGLCEAYMLNSLPSQRVPIAPPFYPICNVGDWRIDMHLKLSPINLT
jgi:hypothetical protein